MIYGFAFNLELPDGKRIVRQVQGSGGLVGDSCLYIDWDLQKLNKVQTKLLSKVQRMSEDGELLCLVNDDLPPSERYEIVQVSKVHDCVTLEAKQS